MRDFKAHKPATNATQIEAKLSMSQKKITTVV